MIIPVTETNVIAINAYHEYSRARDTSSGEPVSSVTFVPTVVDSKNKPMAVAEIVSQPEIFLFFLLDSALSWFPHPSRLTLKNARTMDSSHTESVLQ